TETTRSGQREPPQPRRNWGKNAADGNHLKTAAGDLRKRWYGEQRLSSHYHHV
ncbi:hypothetical protein A2U01_0106283, partial [Trifolium medium]|nr:hypothetical protein [Trifolium medium]